MNQDFPLQCECLICEKYKECVTRDDDLGGPVCEECLPYLISANAVIIDDLVQCGILK